MMPPRSLFVGHRGGGKHDSIKSNHCDKKLTACQVVRHVTDGRSCSDAKKSPVAEAENNLTVGQKKTCSSLTTNAYFIKTASFYAGTSEEVCLRAQIYASYLLLARCTLETRYCQCCTRRDRS